MVIDENEINRAVRLLKDAPDMNNIAAALELVLDGMRQENRKSCDIIDRTAYICAILWSEDDIISKLKEYGMDEPTDDDVAEVLADIDYGDDLSDAGISAGWEEVIEPACDAYVKRMQKKSAQNDND